MEIKYSHIFITIIFGLALGLRLFFAFSTPNFTPDSYFDIRQVNAVSETGLPIIRDELSYGGRTFLFLPTFHYFLAFLQLFLPAWFVLKVIPNIMMASLVFIVYLIARELTKDEKAAVFSSIIAGFIPVLVSRTVVSVTHYSLVVPLIFLALFCFMKVERPFFMYSFIALMFVLTFTHSSVLVLVFSLVFYLLLTKTEDIREALPEQELIIFSTLLVAWLTFIFFGEALLLHGSALIWQNAPAPLLRSLFSNLDFLGAIASVGIIPSLMTVFALYNYVFVERSKPVYLFASFAITIFLLLWLRLIEFGAGLMFLSVVAAVLSAKFYVMFSSYLKKTRLHNYRFWIILLVVLIVSASSLIPSFAAGKKAALSALNDEQRLAYEWLEENTPKNAVVAASLAEGHLVTAVAKRKNIVDNNFLMVPDASQRYEDLASIYTTPYQITALKALNRYDANYIVISDITRKEFKIRGLAYDDDPKCFNIVYNRDVLIIESLCRLEEE